MAWMVTSICFSITHPDRENPTVLSFFNPSVCVYCFLGVFSGFCRHRQVVRTHLSRPQVTPGRGSASTGG